MNFLEHFFYFYINDTVKRLIVIKKKTIILQESGIRIGRHDGPHLGSGHGTATVHLQGTNL